MSLLGSSAVMGYSYVSGVLFRTSGLMRYLTCRLCSSSKAEDPVEKSKTLKSEIKEKLTFKRAKTPLDKVDELKVHPYAEKEPLQPWPDNTNPHTGEVGGPRGPEPTRYGDWERKGRVTDF